MKAKGKVGGMNKYSPMIKERLIKAMRLSGKRLITPMHYAIVIDTTWEDAAGRLNMLAEKGIVKRHAIRVYTVLI
jgi:hypothetical protein